MPLFVLLYIACCLMVAYLARDRILGFVGSFVLSFIFSPFLMLLVYLLGIPRGRGA
jgi:hypothetical protein